MSLFMLSESEFSTLRCLNPYNQDARNDLKEMFEWDDLHFSQSILKRGLLFIRQLIFYMKQNVYHSSIQYLRNNSDYIHDNTSTSMVSDKAHPCKI